MSYIPRFNVVVSGDERGGLEYWSAKTFKPPKKVVKFRYKVRRGQGKGEGGRGVWDAWCCYFSRHWLTWGAVALPQSDTDLFALNKAKSSVASIDSSPDGTSFVVTSSDFQVGTRAGMGTSVCTTTDPPPACTLR